MILGVCPFSDKGRELAKKIADALPEDFVLVRDKTESHASWTAKAFATRRPTLFIGACGIAVRSIAPFIKDKAVDPPVLVADDRGKYVIPILSGHLGGANALAKRVAAILGAEVVTTTATDAEGLFAVDLFAKRNNLTILDKRGIMRVSAKILREKKITAAVEPGIEYPENLPEELEPRPFSPDLRVDVLIRKHDSTADNAEIVLVPKRYVLGVGCKRGTSSERLLDAFKKFCETQVAKIWGITEKEFLRETACAASIDLKRDEFGLAEFAQIIGLETIFYSAQELNAVPGEFSESAFVREAAGVGNVCERAAVMAAGKNARVGVKKFASEGTTFAAAERVGGIEVWNRSI